MQRVVHHAPLRGARGGCAADGTTKETVWLKVAADRKTKGRDDFISALITAGSDLLSHTVSHAVPSAVAGLTSVFGMGTGVTLLL